MPTAEEKWIPTTTRLFFAYLIICVGWAIWYYLDFLDAFKTIVP